MSNSFGEIREEYATALQEYLHLAEEAALQRGYELGRRAVGQDLGVLDLATIHQEALLEALLQNLGPDGSDLIARRAADFFMETLSPYEMSQRGVQETVARVRESNITLEQRVAERAEALRQAELKYRDLFENAVEGIFQLAPDGHLITANPALARIFGYQTPDLLLASEAPVLPSLVDPTGLDVILRRIHEDGAVSSLELPARRLDGAAIWISVNARVVQSADGGVRHYEGSIEDVTERKSAEILASAQRQVLEMIVTGASVPDVLRTLEGILVEQSEASASSITLDIALADDWREGSASTVQPAGLSALSADLIEAGAGVAPARRWSTSIKSADGLTLATLTLDYPCRLPLHQTETEFPSPRDAPIIAAAIHLAGLAVDRERNADALRRSEHQRLQTEKLRALGQLASGIAHDLNQSLALVAGYGELAQDLARAHRHDHAPEAAPPDADALRDMLRIMRQAALDGGDTVKQLLTFARSREEGAPVEIDLRQLLQDVARLTTPRWRDTAEAAGCHISLHVEADEGLTIVGWLPSLREAFTNLVFNAVDALPSGGVIRLAARRRGDCCVVEVADSGFGMSSDVAARIFEPFFTTKGEGGTGLGLAQVFGVTERHKGQISVRSSPGQGTTFELVFPAATRPISTDQVADSEASESEGLRILSVDDEPALARMVAMALRADGHTIVTALSGEEALAKLTADPFDLVVSDLGMGAGINGWELATQVRQQWPHIRIVLATGWGADIDPDEARERGIEAIVSKPYRLDDLRRAVQELSKR